MEKGREREGERELGVLVVETIQRIYSRARATKGNPIAETHGRV